MSVKMVEPLRKETSCHPGLLVVGMLVLIKILETSWIGTLPNYQMVQILCSGASLQTLFLLLLGYVALLLLMIAFFACIVANHIASTSPRTANLGFNSGSFHF